MMQPMVIFRHSISPKCTRSIPKAVATGASRGDNDHGREAVQEHADYQHQQIYQDQEYILVVAQRDHTLGQHLGNPLPAEIIAQNIAGAQDHQHGTHALNGFLQDGRDILHFSSL